MDNMAGKYPGAEVVVKINPVICTPRLSTLKDMLRRIYPKFN